MHTQYRPVTGYQCLALRRWRNCNVDVTLSHVDVTSPIGAQVLLENANKLAPVAGIFHAAHVSYHYQPTAFSYLQSCTPTYYICHKIHIGLLAYHSIKVHLTVLSYLLRSRYNYLQTTHTTLPEFHILYVLRGRITCNVDSDD